MASATREDMLRGTGSGVTNQSHAFLPLPAGARDMQCVHHGASAPATETRSSEAIRRVVGRTLIAAPRERVWDRLCREPASLWRFALDPGTVSPPHPANEKTAAAMQRLERDGEIVVCLPPEERSFLFHAFGGKIRLHDVQPDTTAVTWIIEFAPSLPFTGRLAATILGWLLDAALVRFKRVLEVGRLQDRRS